MTRPALSESRIRQLRKQALQLQARRYRLALRQDWAALAAPFSSMTGSAKESPTPVRWLGIAGGLLSLLPNKWGRLLSLGLFAWRLVRRATNARRAKASDSP
jgi:hypothetical protein